MSDAGAAATLRLEAPAAVRRLVLADAGRLLVGLLAGNRVARWSCADGTVLSDALYRGAPVTAAAVAPAGDRLALATDDRAVKVVDAATLAPAAELRRPTWPCDGLDFSPDGALLAGFAGGRRVELTVWKVTGGAPLISRKDAVQEPKAVAFAPSGRSLAVGLASGDVVVLDLGSGRSVRTLSEALMAAGGLAFSRDGSALLASTFDGALLAWDTARWGVRKLPGLTGASALAVSPDGGQAVVGRRSMNPPETPAEFRLVALGSGEVLRTRVLGIARTAAVAFTAPGRARVAVGNDASIALHDL